MPEYAPAFLAPASSSGIAAGLPRRSQPHPQPESHIVVPTATFHPAGAGTAAGGSYDACGSRLSWQQAAAVAALAAVGRSTRTGRNGALHGGRGGRKAITQAGIDLCRRAKVACRASTTAWLPGEQDTGSFSSESDYLNSLSDQAKLPAGFRVGTTSLSFIPAEAPDMGKLPMNLTVICADEPTEAYAAVFTKNAFPGAPILVGRKRLQAGAPLQAIVINNKVSNVFPANGGESASEAVCKAAADALNLPGGASSVLPSSTGVIGWQLPTSELVEAMPQAVTTLQADSILPAARGIMTTDRYPKVSSVEFPGGGRLVGIAKGAGMIEPDMATMLCFLLTDVELPESGRDALQSLLADATRVSFNSCSVDGDESTSDTVALLSSGRVPGPSKDVFSAALRAVCQELAAQVVRNGEGTRHVIRVAVTGAADDATALRVAKAVVNGPLFKSAVAGNDPNVGRLVGKVGQALGSEGAAMAQGCICRIGGEVIFEGGQFTLDGEKELRLAGHLKAAEMASESKFPPHGRVVDVQVELGGGGSGKAIVLGSDLTKEYVEINSDYRS
mmetsp:Transcript_127404/g.318058  ORF Transcript_127404/g.318058 Transcript_127404/m.318058 type:complete len:560 (-) Transcript_127404:231-1910(-)